MNVISKKSANIISPTTTKEHPTKGVLRSQRGNESKIGVCNNEPNQLGKKKGARINWANCPKYKYSGILECGFLVERDNNKATKILFDAQLSYFLTFIRKSKIKQEMKNAMEQAKSYYLSGKCDSVREAARKFHCNHTTLSKLIKTDLI